MTILTRYLLKAHLGPFLFSLAALTGLLFLNSIAIRLQELVGKGLSLEIVGEFLLYSLPHTLALSLPMAVLVAVLYTFSDLAASSEITALSAGGVKPTRLLFPVVVAGVCFTGVMLFFNDRVLPESNHRLRTLYSDIANTNPTLQLREQRLNPLRTQDGAGIYYLQADKIDRQTNTLEDVRVVDLSDPLHHRITTASAGVMAFNAERTDLYLTLIDGTAYQFSRLTGEEGKFQTSHFQNQITPLRGIGDIFEQTDNEFRSDREMSFSMLIAEAEARRLQEDSIRAELGARSSYAVRRALGLIPADERERLPAETLTAAERAEQEELLGGAIQFDDLTRSVAALYRENDIEIDRLNLDRNGFLVETHKKLAIAFACIVFVLVGAPLAIRFPRGGVGMVIAASMGIFSFYYVGLIGGETLADRGIASPVVTMWISNSVFLALGLLLLKGMGKETATARGGGWDDLLYTAGQLLRAPLRRLNLGRAE